jgi:hypothetical protein
MIRFSRGLPLLLLFLVLLADPVGAQEVRRLPGGAVSLHNLAGEARLVAGQGDEVVVRLTRGGADGARPEIRVWEEDGRSVLAVVYPGDSIVYPGMGRGSRTTVRVTGDGLLGRDGRDRVTVGGSGRGLEAWVDLQVEVPAGTDVSLHLAAGEARVEGVDARLRIDTGSGDVRARDVAGSLDVDTGSGSVEVMGSAGDVRVDTGSGSVRLEGVRGREVVVDTGSGDVVGRGIQADGVEVDTGSGSIELLDVAAPDVVLDTGSGAVELRLLEDVDRLVVDTGSGSVAVEGPRELGGELELETGSGGIEVDFPVQLRTARRDEVVGTLGDGRGRIVIDTGSGGIVLRPHH